MSADLDVIVIGAGASGLAALAELERAGKQVLCVEARDRIGGRIYTVHDPMCAVPIELGAEFIHGRPPEIWDIVRQQRLRAYDCKEHSVHIKDGVIGDRRDAWLLVDDILEAMKQRAGSGPDQSFEQFLATLDQPAESKQWARSFVEGFNAAHSDRISIKALTAETEASDEIDGDRAFRILDGYDALARALAPGTESVRLNTIVEGIGWSRGSVSVHLRSAMTDEMSTIRAKQVIVTVPLGVLQTGAIRFDPEPSMNLNAARELCFGQVVRLILRFREPVWEEREELRDVGFVLGQGKTFPTWWSTLPMRVPVVTGWSAGPKADALAACDRNEVIAAGIEQLSRITGLAGHRFRTALEQAYLHDWATDPFARGAYSYVPAGSADARERLAEPCQNTLYFAGEAAEFSGHAATVHGAIQAGRRAARRILEG